MAKQGSTALTVKTIVAAEPGKHVRRLYDNKVTGLQLIITPAGSKSWALGFTSPEIHKRRFYKLGFYTSVGLKEARNRAGDVRKLIDKGIDPIEQDTRDEAAAHAAEVEKGTGLVRELFALYVRDLRKDQKRSAKQIESAFAYNCGSILDMKARDVTMEHIADIVSEVYSRAPQQSRHVRNYMHTAFKFGLKYRLSDRWRKKYNNGEVPDFQLTHNPVALTESSVKISIRKHYIKKDDLKVLWHSMGVDALSADLAIAIKLLVATGQRVEEVLHATWGEFDLDGKTWIIPADRRKSRGDNPVDHIVPLTAFHIALLEELRGITSHKKYLFPHIDCDNPDREDRPRGADSLSQAVHRFCIPGPKSERTGFEKFLPKDCRRTFKTLAGSESVGLSLEIRNRLQGHAMDDVGSKHYDMNSYIAEKRQAMETWCRWLDELVTGKKSKVVKLRA